MLSNNAIKLHITNDLLNDSSMELTDDQDLLLSGVLDSMSVMRLVAYIEEQCEMTIPAEDVLLENFGSVEKIQSYLGSKNSA